MAKPPKPKPGKKAADDLLVNAGFKTAEADAILEATTSPRTVLVEPQMVLPNSPSARDKITVIGPAELFAPADRGGDAQTSGDVLLWVYRGDRVTDLDELTASAETVRAYATLETVELWCGLGADVLTYPCWLEITSPDDECPFSLEEPKEDWNAWAIASNGGHSPQEIDGRWFRSNLMGDLGEPMEANNTSGKYAGRPLWEYITTPDTANTNVVAVLSVEAYLAIPRPEPI